jgi:glycine cleavage system H protein
MSEIPADLKYTETHEWVRVEEDGTVTVGITDHAQEMLGDIVFIELPKHDAVLRVGQECAVVESVKAAADIYAPISGEVIDINETLQSTSATVNGDPYGEGWLFCIKPSDMNELENLLSADEYNEQLSTES